MWAKFCGALSSVISWLQNFRNKVSTWFFAVVVVIVFPMFPLGVEARKNAFEIKDENLLLTAAVLSVSFFVTSEGNFYRASYVLLFLYSVCWNFGAEPVHSATLAPGSLDTYMGWAGTHSALIALLATVVLHSIERFNWHVVLNRRFPDWMEKS